MRKFAVVLFCVVADFDLLGLSAASLSSIEPPQSFDYSNISAESIESVEQPTSLIVKR